MTARQLLLLLAALAAGVTWAQPAGAAPAPLFDHSTREFLDQLDADAISRLAVQYRGRIATLDTLARDQLRTIYGEASIEGTAPAVAYLELMLDRQGYWDAPLIYIRERSMRSWVLERLTEAGRRRFVAAGYRLPPALLVAQPSATGTAQPPAAGTLGPLAGELAELAQQPAMRLPLERLDNRVGALIDPSPLRVVPDDAAWLTPGDAVVAAGAATDTAGQAAGLWQSLKAAWLARDAGEVNRLADEFAEAATSRPGYPSAARRKVELLYNRSRYGTIAFVGFAVAVAMLLPGAGAGRRNWRRTGLEVLAASTIVLAGGFAARWMLSGRPWYLPPIMNQFEAVTGSALLAAMVALVLEWRRGGGWFALAAALYATVALLAGFFLPATMGATVSAAHGILHSPLMAVHVAIIIVGHAMVGMAAVVSVAFLLAGAARRRSALGPIDRTNLVLVQLAAWLVTLGTVLGAVWGDFAWGRWWGWDPKETWALMTAIIFIGIVHLRLVVPARHRGWATAVACLVGAAVMLFNWIGVNYFLTGLHSYA